MERQISSKLVSGLFERVDGSSIEVKYLSDPYSWEECKFIVEEDLLHLLARTYQGAALYVKALRDDVDAHVLATKFKDIDEGSGADWVLVLNDFPYGVQNADHWLVWSLQQMGRDQIEEIAKERFSDREVIIFCNPEHLQSVKKIHHWHIFVRQP
eukprot:Platyproteum_vivax@DN6584_c0_g1_i1.p1